MLEASSSHPNDLGQQLINRGWRQGAILPSLLYPVICDPRDLSTADAVLSLPQRPAEGVPLHAIAARSRTGRQERLVIISQTCDIARATDIEPNVLAARAFYTRNDQQILVARRSTRRFILDETPGDGALIVDMTRIVSIEKSLVCRIAPLAMPTAKVRRDFALWLGDRFARPAYPDEFNERILSKLLNVLHELLAQRDQRLLFLNSQGVVLRLVPPGDVPPFPVKLYAMLPADDAEGNAFEVRLCGAVAGIQQTLFAELDPADVQGHAAITPIRFDQMTAQQLIDSDPLRFP